MIEVTDVNELIPAKTDFFGVPVSGEEYLLEYSAYEYGRFVPKRAKAFYLGKSSKYEPASVQNSMWYIPSEDKRSRVWSAPIPIGSRPIRVFLPSTRELMFEQVMRQRLPIELTGELKESMSRALRNKGGKRKQRKTRRHRKAAKKTRRYRK